MLPIERTVLLLYPRVWPLLEAGRRNCLETHLSIGVQLSPIQKTTWLHYTCRACNCQLQLTNNYIIMYCIITDNSIRLIAEYCNSGIAASGVITIKKNYGF